MIIRITRDVAQKRLSDVPQEKAFWVCGGRVLNNLKDLATALNEISDDTCSYHSNDRKNDFSRWVADVICDDKLARDLQKAKNRLEAASAVTCRIQFLESKIR